MASTESFYPGSSYSLEPNYGDNFVGYRVPFKSIGITTDARTANQVKDVSNKLNMGLKHVELSFLTPEVFESIPKQHTKEIQRVLKLTGAEASVHGPLVDPSGYTQQGWSESMREAAERKMELAIERSHELDPKGNIPVTFHSANAPGTEWKYEKDASGKLVRKPVQIVGIDRDTGRPSGFKQEEVYFKELEKPEKISPERRINMYNNTQWKNQFSSLNLYKKEADEMINSALFELAPVVDDLLEGKKSPNDLSPVHQRSWVQLKRGESMLDQIESQFENIYDNARKYAEPSSDMPEKYKKEFLKKRDRVLDSINNEWVNYAKEQEKQFKKGEIGMINPAEKSQLLDDSITAINNLTRMRSDDNRVAASVIPRQIVPLEDFAKDKASDTFSNVALHGYKKFNDKAPIVSIENPPAGMGISTGEDLKELVKESREKFVEKAVKEGYSKSEAKDVSKKLIGATWDVGHINMLRKFGAEKKDIVKETEAIAPMVKHVHLSDNFGLEHTELPMGMGNVPVKEMFEKLGKEGFKGKRITEAISWWQHFSEQGKISPLTPTLEAFGSPLYGTGAPYWNQQIGTYGTYSAGYGRMLPDQHFSAYGAGWESLPVELGGQVQGKRDRVGGAPME